MTNKVATVIPLEDESYYYGFCAVALDLDDPESELRVIARADRYEDTKKAAIDSGYQFCLPSTRANLACWAASRCRGARRHGTRTDETFLRQLRRRPP